MDDHESQPNTNTTQDESERSKLRLHTTLDTQKPFLKEKSRYNYVETNLSDISPFLSEFCSQNKDNYHCRGLQKLLFCAVNRARYPENDFLKDNCEENAFCKSANYHSNYYIRHIYDDKSLRNNVESRETSLLYEQENFVERMKKLAEENS